MSRILNQTAPVAIILSLVAFIVGLTAVFFVFGGKGNQTTVFPQESIPGVDAVVSDNATEEEYDDMSGEGYSVCPLGEFDQLVFPEDKKSITCVVQLGENKPYVLLEYAFDTIKLSRQGKELINFECDSETGYTYDCYAGGFEMKFVDVTYDGYRDISITSVCGAYQCASSFYAYDVNTELFTPLNALVDIMEPVVDGDSRTISSFSKGDGYAMSWTVTTYKLEGSEYVLVKDCSRYQKDWTEEESEYVYVCKERKGSEMATTSFRIIPYEEAIDSPGI